MFCFLLRNANEHIVYQDVRKPKIDKDHKADHFCLPLQSLVCEGSGYWVFRFHVLFSAWSARQFGKDSMESTHFWCSEYKFFEFSRVRKELQFAQEHFKFIWHHVLSIKWETGSFFLRVLSLWRTFGFPAIFNKKLRLGQIHSDSPSFYMSRYWGPSTPSYQKLFP